MREFITHLTERNYQNRTVAFIENGTWAPQAAKGNQITAFEKACDDYLTSYLQSAKLTPFGDSVIIAYLAAREAEFTAARVIMAGRFAGLEPDTIRERLRESYV